MSKSLISSDKQCWVCGSTRDIHKHHIYGGPNRSLSESWGCWVYLCAYHHNMSDKGVHFDRNLDALLKTTCQRRWEEKYGENRERFRQIFGRSYL